MSEEMFRHYRVSQPVVAGMVNEMSIEFFAFGNQYKALFKGELLEIADLPESKLKAIERDMRRHPEALAALDQLQLTNRIDRITQYLWCRYGGFDMAPDMVNDSMGAPEYWPCPLRGNCPHEFKLCAPVSGPEGDLSAAELRVAKLLATHPNMADKQLADALGISRFTVMVHLSNIREKMGLQTRAAIVAMAIQRNLIQPQYHENF